MTRCNGGDNAERAAVPDSEAHALRSLPSGIFNPRAASVNGNSAGRPAGADGEPAASLCCDEELRPFVDDAARLFNRVLDNGATMLFKGGQTTYPFVSSSNATADGARADSGVGPARDARAPSSGGRRRIRSRLSRLIDMLPTAA